MHPSSKSETIKERLDAMPMEDFEVLLKQVAGNKNQETMPEHAEILKQLEGTLDGHGKAQPDQAMLSTAKYHSSLQSLNGKGDPPSAAVLPLALSLAHDANPNAKPLKGHHHYHLNHTSTLTTINSTSSLNSIGLGQGGDDERPKQPHNGPLSPLQDDHSITPPRPPEGASLPHTYFFNERDADDLPNGGIGGLDSSFLNTTTLNTSFDACPFNTTPRVNSHQRAQEYTSVASLTTGGSSAPSLVGAGKNGPGSGSEPRCLTPNFPSQGMITKSPSEGSNDKSKKPKKKANKNIREKEVDLQTLPGFRGTDDIENLVQFVEGMDSATNTGKKNKRKERLKEKDTLVKSASLDENHLNSNAKRATPDSTPTAPPSKSLKEVEKKSEKAVSANPIPSLAPSDTSDTIDTRDSADANDTADSDTDTLVIETLPPRTPTAPQRPPTAPAPTTPTSHTQIPGRKGREGRDSRDRGRRGSASGGKTEDSLEEPFELVQPKRKGRRRTNTQREAETFSRGKATEQARKERPRSRRNPGGDRRKSVGSVPGSENDDQSDDDSVRSLPAGECTPKEPVPKPCASSGGTPQTSYADIARMTEVKSHLPALGSLSTGTDPEANSKTATAPAQVPSPLPKKQKPEPPPASPVFNSNHTHQYHKDTHKDCRPEDSAPFKKTGYAKPPPTKPPTPTPTPTPTAPSNPPPNQPNQSYRNDRSHFFPRKSVGELDRDRERTYSSSISSFAKGDENRGSSGVGVTKVLIEDKTEFPEINASISMPPKAPFHKRNFNHNHSNTNTNTNTNGNVPHLNNNNNNLLNTKKNQSKTPTPEVWQMIQETKVIPPPVSVHIVQPVFVQPTRPPPEEQPSPLSPPPLSQPPPPQQQPPQPLLVNGDHVQIQTVELVDLPAECPPRRRRNSLSFSSTGGDVPVVFCGGNFEREIPINQDIGFEFGFDVMSAMSSNISVSPVKVEREVEMEVEVAPPFSPEPLRTVRTQPEREESLTPLTVTLQTVDVPLSPPVPEMMEKMVQGPSPRESLLGSYRGPPPPSSHSPSQPPPPQPQTPPQQQQHQQQLQQIYIDTRRGSHPQYGGGGVGGGPGPRHTRITTENFRTHQRNGRVYTSPLALGPGPGGYPLHLASSQPPPQYGAHHSHMTQGYATILQPGSYARSNQTQTPHGQYIHPGVGSVMFPLSTQPEIFPEPPAPSAPVLSPAPSASPINTNININANANANVDASSRGPPPVVRHPSSTSTMPYVGTVYYDQGPPYGPNPPCLYYNPDNYGVPIPPGEVESWMNCYIERTYSSAEQGQLKMHRID